MAAAKNAQAGRLLAGAAQVDITPPMGTQIAGDIGRRRPAEWVMDPIFAKALVLELGGRRACILSLDLLAVGHSWVREIRRRAQEEFGLAPEAVMVHVTQNHAAPSLGHLMLSEDSPLAPKKYPWLHGGDDRYHPLAVEGVLEAIRRASAALEPVRMAAARGVDGRVAFNRRYILRDGTAEMMPRARLNEILQREGPSDPEVGVACFTTDSLRTVAALLHHTCHPVHGYPMRYVTAGWPGAWCGEAQKFLGAACVPMVLNGCCGDVIYVDLFNPDHDPSFERMGRLLAQTTRKVLEGASFEEVTELACLSRRIRIPLRELDPAKIEAARRLLAEHPEPMWRDESHSAVEWDWCYALANVDLARVREQSPEFEYEVQAFRIGPMAVVALVGEPFVEGQLRLKLESPARYTFVAHMSNGYVGYIPTPAALKRGGYETRTAHWSKLAPEALDTIVDEGVRLLKEMF